MFEFHVRWCVRGAYAPYDLDGACAELTHPTIEVNQGETQNIPLIPLGSVINPK
jgi:hypothetical protein